jgi:hypothetical protein
MSLSPLNHVLMLPHDKDADSAVNNPDRGEYTVELGFRDDATAVNPERVEARSSVIVLLLRDHTVPIVRRVSGLSCIGT